MARGGRYTLLAPEEEVARVSMPGGTASITPLVEGRTGAVDRNRAKHSRHRIQRGRARSPPPGRHSPPPQKGTKGSRGGKSSGGKGDRNTDTSSKGSLCFSWSKRFGPCKDIGVHAPCPSGRTRACHVCGSGDHRGVDCPREAQTPKTG